MSENLITEALEVSQAAFNSEERTNFKSLWDSCIGICRPSASKTQSTTTPGSRDNPDRVIDIGINSLSTFTSGLTSVLTPKGSKFIDYTLLLKAGETPQDEHKRWLNKCSHIAQEILEQTNFFGEISKSFSDLGLIGTTMFLTDPDEKSYLKFRTVFIDKFAFTEGPDGLMDRSVMELQLTARQIQAKFGEDKLSSKMKSELDAPNPPKHKIIHLITPRDNANPHSINPLDFTYASVYVDQAEKLLLGESGFNDSPAAICRWGQQSNETYGRSPAMDSLGNLYMLNTMETSKLKSAQRLANPSWLVSDDGSTRNVGNTPGSITYWNAGNPHSKPEQLIQRDNPGLTHEYIQQRSQEVESSFFCEVWKPFQGMGQNPTATEVSSRVALSKQNLIPKVNIVLEQLLRPTFVRVFNLLEQQGCFPPRPEGLVTEVTPVFTSTGAAMIKDIEVTAIFQTLESMALLQQIKPDVVDIFEIDKIARMVADVKGLPVELIRSKLVVDNLRTARAEQKQAAQQQQQELEMAKVYQNTNVAPQANSPGSY